MNARHRIRLAGPWGAEILHSSSHLKLANTNLKAALGGTAEHSGHPFYGKLKLRRNFNLPTGLDNHSVVWLCAEGLPPTAHCEIFLNRRTLDRTDGDLMVGQQVEIAITDALENFNRIELVLSCSEAVTPIQTVENPASILVQASVWLEIE